MDTTKKILDNLKGYFQAGAQPTQSQFEELIDTYLVNTDKVGINAEVPLNNLDIKGNTAIGTGYATSESAPENGLIVEGKVGIGTHIADETLQVNGNVRIDSGNLYMGEILVITSAGEWNGSAIEDGNSGSSSWTDGVEQVTTQAKVGIGTADPASELHVNGSIQVDGLVNKQQVAFNAFGFNSIVPIVNTVLFTSAISGQPNSRFWNMNTGIFKPDEAHAGTYCFMVSLTIKQLDEKSEEPIDGRVFFSSSPVSQDSEIMVIREPGQGLHSSASFIMHMDGNSEISIRTDHTNVQIDTISFTGYRI